MKTTTGCLGFLTSAGPWGDFRAGIFWIRKANGTGKQTTPLVSTDSRVSLDTRCIQGMMEKGGEMVEGEGEGEITPETDGMSPTPCGFVAAIHPAKTSQDVAKLGSWMICLLHSGKRFLTRAIRGQPELSVSNQKLIGGGILMGKTLFIRRWCTVKNQLLCLTFFVLSV